MAKETALDQRPTPPVGERDATSPAAGLLDVRDLAVDYRIRGGVVHAVRAASVRVAPGEMVALVGESGSGKSTTAHAVLGLLAPTARVVGGRVDLAGEDLTRLGAERMRRLRGRTVALIPQDPGSSLNPVVRVGDQVAEALVVHGLADRRRARAAAPDILAEAGIADPGLRARQFPHELSGGLRQRVLIAIALAARPRLIVADEPTSALDVVVARQILDHLQTLTLDAGIGVLLVTHDLAVAAQRCARIVVMAAGEVVEDAAAAEVIAAPKHPATQALVAATASRHPFRRPAAVPRPRTPPGAGAQSAAHVRIERLVKEYRLPRAADGDGVVRAVDDVSFDIARGQTFALVGASGSGKSTLARMLLRFTTPTSGRLLLDGRDITAVRGGELRRLRRRMQLVHQSPFASLNPRFTVEQIIGDPLAAFGLGTRRERRARAAELVDLVALPADTLSRRPAELSGGQRQRVAIARALALHPGLVVCDEPVSALDATVQAQILDLLVGLQEELGVSYLFISHDLTVVRRIAHRVGVLRQGRLVEDGPAEQVLTAPRHPYTQELVAAAHTEHRTA
ncbi:ABC transporter ATP-binding protein [Frankia sp. AgB32]|uniref:dipeptide ABC transporter ATP-binding protein n=1 Tax=Frankia sp. AgB32 TaxID=631119 RepID=UPI00200E00EA|nr:ABC transporter ATP-binding protein [Frankia sp. AgB32]MCK9897891.1 ABC transporter ATP-binding protein [Frankia sp. AgB32]